jgi:hypothetical protein
MWAAILSSRPARWLAGGLAALLGILGIIAHQRRDAAQDALTEAENEDYENADDIRRRVERDLASELRKYDSAGFRDE